MKVRDLIQQLKKYDPDLQVVIEHSGGDMPVIVDEVEQDWDNCWVLLRDL